MELSVSVDLDVKKIVIDFAQAQPVVRVEGTIGFGRRHRKYKSTSSAVVSTFLPPGVGDQFIAEMRQLFADSVMKKQAEAQPRSQEE